MVKNSKVNPFRQETVFPIVLEEKSVVTIEVFETNGKKLFSVINHLNLSAGKQDIRISRNQLTSGKYTAKITVKNSQGAFTENIEIIVH